MAEAEAQGTLGAIRGLSVLPVARQIGVTIGLAASIALAVSVVLWSREPAMQPLTSQMDNIDVSQAVDVLSRYNIRYKIDSSSGALLVPATKIHEARIKLATEGITTTGSVGFELLEKQSAMDSQFMELARYKRALEGELARSISSIHTIKSARVHLAIPKQSSFVRNRKKSSASVFVDLFAGSQLTDEQVSAITHLVGASVPELSSADVAVIDEKGHLLTQSNKAGQDGLSTRQLDYVRKLEEKYSGRILDILEPIVGFGKVRAQVSADLDFTIKESTNESFNPERTVVRSEKVLEESGSSSTIGGVPGAEANNADAGTAETASAGDSKKQTIKNYELDKTVSRTKQPIGTIKRLSIAVVLDEKVTVDEKSGKESSQPFTEEEIEKIKNLVKQAVGFSDDRNDSLDILNTAFVKQPELEPVEPAKMWEQQWFWDAVKQGAGALFVLILVFAVLRPTLRNLVTKAPVPSKELVPSEFANNLSEAQQQQMMQQNMVGGARQTMQMPQQGIPQQGMPQMAAMGGPAVTLSGQGQGPQLQSPGATYEDQLLAVRGLANQNPEIAADIVKTWIAEEPEQT